MKFKDKLETLPDETYIKVGTEYGSSYLYIGKAGDMKKHILEYTGNIKSYWRQRETEERLHIETLAGKANMLGYIKSRSLSYDGYQDYLKECIKNINIHKSRMEDVQTKLLGLKALSMREVKEVNLADENLPHEALNIIIEGYESGRLWLVSEIEEREGLLALGYSGGGEIQGED